VGAVDASDGSGFAFVDAPIVVDDPAVFAADPVAQACAPGLHAALWRAALAVLGQQIPLSIVIDTAGGGNAYTMRFCPLHPLPGLSAGAGFLLMGMYIEDLATAPTTPGTYTWSALLTPPVSGTTTPDPSRTVEVRALVPLPETLTLRARYDAKTQAAVVSGALTAGGSPQAGVTVDLSSSTGSTEPTDLGSVTTDAAGRFSMRRPVDRTTTFNASPESNSRPCSAPSNAPGGCVGETVSEPDSVTATAIVPRKTDPKLAIRPHDQAVARRAMLIRSDFPSGWSTQGDGPGPCDAFTPALRKLTATGQTFSPVFVAPDGTAAALSTTSVFVTRTDATTAYTREAQAAAVRCEAKETAGGSNATISAVGPFAVPRIGDASRAFRAVVDSPFGRIYVDIVFLRVGRAVIELDVYSVGASEVGLEAQLARALAARARRQ
jgi:hypothetical protein